MRAPGFLSFYQAWWGTEENRGPPLVPGPSPPDFPQCSLKRVKPWESPTGWNNELTIGSLQSTAHLGLPHRASENSKCSELKRMPTYRGVWLNVRSSRNCRVSVFGGVLKHKLPKSSFLMRYTILKSKWPRVLLKGGRGGCIESGGSAHEKESIYSSAPLIFSFFSSALWPQTCGHPKIPSISKET